MTPERQKLAEQIFLEAMETSAHMRRELIVARCGSDAQMLAEVHSLLACADEAVTGPLDHPHRLPGGKDRNATPGNEADAPLEPGATFGNYTILSVLGSGGMGIVYLAEQRRPRRTVALKVIRPGYADPATLRRFEFESQMLARLQHVGIAQVFEAGAADAGRGTQPYFAMEHVDGALLTDHVEKHYPRPNFSPSSSPKPSRERARHVLEILTKVCDAVEHAHQRGVIHRDIKPANILIDSSGQPKVLDFGVARATDSDHRHTMMQTGMGQLIGTLPYMSPEQVAGDPAQVDTRSDVYAIGVTAYQLLSGRMPHELGRCSIAEAARIIRDEDPESLGTLDHSLSGDIETIVFRAMEKERTRRYQSAGELGAEIRRYLRGEPIDAKRDSLVYVLKKQIRRHTHAAIGAGAVLLVLIGSSIIFAVQSARNSTLAKDNGRLAQDWKHATGEARNALEAVTIEKRRADEELSRSNIERSRLLRVTGSPTTAEPLLWREHFQRPDDIGPHWALWEHYSHVPSILATSIGKTTPQGIDVSSDGARVAFGDGNRGLFVYTADLSARLAEIRGDFKELVRCVQWNNAGNVLAVGDFSGSLHTYDGATFSRIATATADERGVIAITFSPDGTRLAAGGSRGRVSLWSAPDLTLVTDLAMEPTSVRAMAFSPDGSTLATLASSGEHITLRDAATGAIRSKVPAGLPQAQAMVWSTDARSIYVSGSLDGGFSVARIDVATGTRVFASPIGTSGCNSLHLVGDGSTLFADGASVCFLDAATGNRTRTLIADGTQYFSAGISRDGTRIVTTSAAGELRAWEERKAAAARRFGALPGPAVSVSFSPDGRVLASGRRDIELFDVGTAELLTSLKGEATAAPAGESTEATRLQGVSFMPDGRGVLTWEGGDVRLLDLVTGGVVRTFAGEMSGSGRIGTDRAGTVFVGVKDRRSVRVIDVHGGHVVAAMPQTRVAVEEVALTPDGGTLFAVEGFGATNVFDVATASVVRTVQDRASGVCVAVSPDGDHFMTGSWRRDAAVWSIKDPASCVRLEGHSSSVRCGSFSPDGKLVATASFDRTARLWDASTGRLLLTLECDSAATSVAFSPEGSWLAVTTDSGGTTVWDLTYYNRHIAQHAEWNKRRLIMLADDESVAADWKLPAMPSPGEPWPRFGRGTLPPVAGSALTDLAALKALAPVPR